MTRKTNQTGIILASQKLKRGCVFEGVACVLFIEAERGGGGPEGVQVCEEGVEEGGGGGAAEEEGAFGVFDGEGEGVRVGAFGARGFGFARKEGLGGLRRRGWRGKYICRSIVGGYGLLVVEFLRTKF